MLFEFHSIASFQSPIRNHELAVLSATLSLPYNMQNMVGVPEPADIGSTKHCKSIRIYSYQEFKLVTFTYRKIHHFVHDFKPICTKYTINFREKIIRHSKTLNISPSPVVYEVIFLSLLVDFLRISLFLCRKKFMGSSVNGFTIFTISVF